jgi:iron complex transport system ATP-binding protein
MSLELEKSHTPDNNPAFVNFKNVSICINGRNVLNSINIQIPDGEHIAILGPNGSGKSTLIKAITREYYPVYSGTDTVSMIWGRENWDVFKLRSYFGFVSHDLQYTFTRNISGRDVILSGFFSSIGLFFHDVLPEMREKAEEISRFLEISHLMERPFSEMSSGEARRFLIGRALVHNPKVLILDEPSNSLDLTALHMLRTTMRKIAKNTVIILVTHNLPDIIPEISRVILMKEGKIFIDGQKKTVLTNENIKAIFEVPVRIHQEEEYYYAAGY